MLFGGINNWRWLHSEMFDICRQDSLTDIRSDVNLRYEQSSLETVLKKRDL